MSTQIVTFVDPTRKVIARSQVIDRGERFEGTIDLGGAPSAVRSLFEEFEEIVNGQMFSFLDDIQGKIASLPLQAVLDNGAEMRLEDLQVYPSTGKVSFRLAAVAGAAKKPA
jgi:hypothetical protein